MTDGTAGWFRDPTDPALARWHDGDRWTEHTLVIADQTPGSEPAPPEPTPAPAAYADDTESYGGYTDGPKDDGLSDRVRGLPTWAKVLAPLVVVAVLGIAFLATAGGDDDGDDTKTAGTEVATLDDAVDAARDAGLTDEVSDARGSAALIERICDAAKNPSDVDELGQDLGNLPADTPSDLRQEIRALGKGAEERCASDLADAPDLINDLQDAAAVAFATTTTAITLVPDGTGDTVPGATDAGTDGGGTSGTGGKTATTKKGATTTTAKPTTTTTVPTVGLGDRCSTEGAKGKNGSGNPMTCTRTNCTSDPPKLAWAFQTKTCQPPPTSPTTTPGQTIPTNTTTTTSGP